MADKTKWTAADMKRARELLAGPLRDTHSVLEVRGLLERALDRIVELVENANRMRDHREALEGLPPGTLQREPTHGG